uniref:Uncharacterized protein n=1 Tax=Fagus sylvatica TaxID=28930 RepID=A0A2N9ID92_FAGSY
MVEVEVGCARGCEREVFGDMWVAIGAGMVTALESGLLEGSHDGLTFPDLMRSKIISALARRDFLLAWTKIKGDEVVRLGVVESTHDSA